MCIGLSGGTSISMAGNDAGNVVGNAFGVYNGWQCSFRCSATPMARRLGRKLTHSIALLVGGIRLISIFFVHSATGLIVP